MRRLIIFFVFVIGFSITIFSPAARAIPLVSIDDYRVITGDIFNVEVLISDIDPSLPVQAFEFDIDYDPTIITPLNISSGDYLPSPLGIPPLIIESDLNPPDINFAMTTVGWGGGSGSGILATITFQATNIGISTLHLNDVILSSPGGTPIYPVILNDGSITVQNTVIPEPATFLLAILGMLGVITLSLKGKKNI